MILDWPVIEMVRKNGGHDDKEMQKKNTGTKSPESCHHRDTGPERTIKGTTVQKAAVVMLIYGDSHRQTDDGQKTTKKLADVTHLLTTVSDFKTVTLYRKHAYSPAYLYMWLGTTC
jgi:hypothetical protein